MFRSRQPNAGLPMPLTIHLRPLRILARGPGSNQPRNIGIPTRSNNHQNACVIRASMMSKKFVGAQDMGSLFPFFLLGLVWSMMALVTNADPALASRAGAVPDVTIEAIAPLASPDPLIMLAFFRLLHPTSAAQHRTKSSHKIADRRQVTRSLSAE